VAAGTLTASILRVDDESEEPQGFAYRSGYAPEKRNPDGTLTPLNRDALGTAAANWALARNFQSGDEQEGDESEE